MMTIDIVNMTKQKAIKELFKKSGYNVSQFARAVGFTRNQVYAWFNGTAEIRENNLEMIANRLNHKVDWKGSNRLELIKGEEMFGYNQDKQTIENQNELIQLLRDQVEMLKNQVESLKNNESPLPDLSSGQLQCLVDLEKSTILTATVKYAQFIGYSQLEMLGMPYVNVLHEDEYEFLAYNEKRERALGYNNEGVWKIVTKDGRAKYISVESNNLGHDKMIIDVTSSNIKDYEDWIKIRENTENKA